MLLSEQEVLADFLNQKVLQYENPEFITSDPIQIPHRFTQKQDIEISGFLTATIAWGKRNMIIRNANRMMELLDNSPYDFIMNHQKSDLDRLEGFVHRTFNSIDLNCFLKALQCYYRQYNSLETIFIPSKNAINLNDQIPEFKKLFFSNPHPKRSQKHISDPSKGSAAKRIHMYLRWMVRDAKKGVDFGIWKQIPTSVLSCPLDVHSGNVARQLGLLERKSNDRKAVEALDKELRKLDPIDPVKYDFALFGTGVFEKNQ